MSDNPEKAPAPIMLAQMCAIHAWADHVDDDSRRLLEWSHEVIMALCLRMERWAVTLEKLEARMDELEAK
jgi:hypothetical protein